MAAITYEADAPGRGGFSKMLAHGQRVLKVVTGSFAFDSSYPTGGEDISDIFNQFSALKGIIFDQPLTGAQTGKFAKVDYTNKLLQLFTNASPAVEVANASDQSAISGLRFFAWGY